MIIIKPISLAYRLKHIGYPVHILFLISLLISPVLATDNSILHKFHSYSPKLQKEINDEIAEKIATKEIIANEIAEREKLLSEDLLKINDDNATKITTNRIVVKTKDNTKISNKDSDILVE